MNNDEIFKILKSDYENAKKSKVEIDTLITEANEAYYGTSKKNKKMIMKEVAKMIEWQKPNIKEPFLRTNSPIKVKNTGGSGSKSEIENYLNSVFTGDIDRENLIDKIVDILIREGTVWTRTGWVRKVIRKEVTELLTMDEVLQLDEEEVVRITEAGEDVFRVTKDVEVVVSNHPKSRVCRNENCFPDPSAREESELQYFVEKRYATYYDLVETGIYDETKLNKLKQYILNSGLSTDEKGILETYRDATGESTGFSDTDVTNDLNRIKVQLIEYWGYLDTDGKGKAKPIVASWVDKFDMLLSIEDNDLPSGEIPYRSAVYSSRPFSLWGNPLAFFISANQDVKNGIVRGILDNLALANNGQKFIQRNALDFTNLQRLKNKERYVVVNKPDAIQDGSYNNLPPAIFNTLGMIDTESEKLSGLTSNGAQLSQANVSKEDSQNLSMSQQKMASIVRTVSHLLSRNAKEWLTMAEVFLDDEQIVELFSNDGTDENDNYDINLFRNSVKTNITMTVGTDVSKNQELHSLNMLMQQSKALGESVPAPLINNLVAKMFDLFDMNEDANQLRNYKPEPSQEQQMMQQLQIQEQQLKVAKLQAEVQKIQVDAGAKQAETQFKGMEAQSNVGYKAAQSQEKMAKTQAHRIDSALKPGAELMNMREKEFNMKEKENKKKE